MKTITAILSAAVFYWVTSQPYAEQPRVTASWYGEKYRGNTCADNKTVFDPDDPTLAAHRPLPFGTRVKVSITKDKFIVVTIVERGPCTKCKKTGEYSREIDLSKAAFASLCDTHAGLIQVKLEVLKGEST